MNSIHWISIVMVSSLTIISGQSDLVFNETSMVSQWIAPVTTNAHHQGRPVRRISLFNSSPQIEQNITKMRSSAVPDIQRIDSAPPYATSDYSTVSKKNSSTLRKVQLGQTGGQTGGQAGGQIIGQTYGQTGVHFTNNNPSLRSNYAPHYHPVHVPIPIPLDGHEQPYNNDLLRVLLIATFTADKCEGIDQKDFTLQLRFPSSRLCFGYANSVFEDLAGNTITSQVGGVATVNKFTNLFILIEFKGGHNIMFLLGFVESGNLQGKYIAARVIFDQWQITHKCRGGVGPSFLQSDAATIMVIDPSPQSTQTVAECYNMPPFCMDKFRSGAKTLCQGTAILT